MMVLAIIGSSFDPLTAAIIEGLDECGAEVYCTEHGNGAKRICTDREFIELYPMADYILAFFNHQQTPPPKNYLIDSVNGWGKTAYVDGSEYNYSCRLGMTNERLHPMFRDKARWYFKRECTLDLQALGIIPLPYAALKADFGNHELAKDIDVLCAFGHLTTGKRAEAAQAVRELAAEGYMVITSPVPDYLRYIARSWITIEAYGGGECNARAWQIMANKSAMFAQKYNIVMPSLEAGRHYVEWSSGEELKARIREWLADKDGLQELIDAGFVNLCLHHTSKKRAEYLLECLR